MQFPADLLTLGLVAMAAAKGDHPGTGCSPTSDKGDCAALLALAAATDVTKWTKAAGWLENTKSVCEWHGVTCNKAGRVEGLDLKNNALSGTIPDAIRGLTELKNISFQNSRPANYQGCNSGAGGNDLKNSSLPGGFFTLSKLESVDFEYTCLGGTLDGFGNLTSLLSLQLHGNAISGSIPHDLDNLESVQVLKLGRNPITGQLPLFKNLKSAIQFNCNFCALSGPFPDMFDFFPSLKISYWDGNGFTGPLPPSISNAKKVSRISFNINQFSGDIPPGLCNTPAGDGPDTPDVAHDCRIGGDTDLAVYQADHYPWIIRGNGNLYNCGGIPKCAHVGSCNKTHGVAVVNPPSYVRCK